MDLAAGHISVENPPSPQPTQGETLPISSSPSAQGILDPFKEPTPAVNFTSDLLGQAPIE